MITDPAFYAAAIPAVILVGFAKGGFAGLVIIAMSLLATVIHPVKAAAIMLPILIAQDVVSLWAYRKSFDREALTILLPGALVGVIVATTTAAYVSDSTVRVVIGVVAIAFSANYFFGLARRLGDSPLTTGRAAGMFWGAVSGFTSNVSHAGGPPYQIWMLSRRLNRDMLVGTTSWYFAILNVMKAPFIASLGQLDAEALKTAGALLPLAIVSTLAGIWLVRRIPVDRFYGIIYVLMLLAGSKLAYEGLSGLARSASP